MKGIILAGGKGTRLYPVTKTISKQFLLVYDKPVIYYPLATLMSGGIKEIMIITTEDYLPMYLKQLGDGSEFGISLEYAIQKKPKGIAESFIIAEDFIGSDNVTLLLGDNIFLGQFDFAKAVKEFDSGAVVFSFPVDNPQAFGIVDVDPSGKAISIVEKPKEPKTNLAVVGLYIYSPDVIEIAKSIEPSARGELEISDLNQVYLTKEEIKVVHLSQECKWYDCGSYQSLLEVGNYISSLSPAERVASGYLEIEALKSNFISKDEYAALLNKMPDCGYKELLHNLPTELKLIR